MSYTAVTVTCLYSASVTGSVVFTPTAPMSNGGVIAPATPVRVDLAGTSGAAVLKANDDTGTTPSGVGYTVVESIDGAPSREFVITLHAASPSVNLGDLAPAVSSPLYQYAPLDSPAFTGTPTINGTPFTGGGGGAVTSVNGRTGDVVLVKTDVGLGNVSNTADASKPVSTAQAAADGVVQSFAIQRANHTGTQSADTLTDGTTNKAYTAVERTKLGAITGTNTGDQDLSALASKAQAIGYALVFGGI